MSQDHVPTIAELTERFRELEPVAVAIAALDGRTPALEDRVRLEKLALQFEALGSDISHAVPVARALSQQCAATFWRVLEDCRVQAVMGHRPETWEAYLTLFYGLG